MRQRTRLGEEARFELTMAATARERANRPVSMLVLAGAVLAAAAVFAAYAVASRASSRAQLRRGLSDQVEVEARVGEWKKLAEAETANAQGGAAGKPGDFRVSKMEELATRAGMKARPNAPSTRDDKSRAGIVVFTHVYTEVRDPSLSSLVEWVRSACAEIGGLEVMSLTVRPEPAGWKMDVTFRRWERAGS